MDIEEILKILQENHDVCFNKGTTFCKAYIKTIDILKQIESLQSEYKAYHIDSDDYWRGMKYTLACLCNAPERSTT